jgi:hypothetical protein
MLICQACIKRLLPSPPPSHTDERFYTEVLLKFTDFRTRTGLFDRSKPHWNIALSPSHFWRNYKTDCTEPVDLALCDIAIRLFTTPSNSVWAERGFSEMNRIHNKSRASLKSDKVNMLCSISINRRVLDSGRRKVHLLSEKEMNDLEADLAYLEAEALQDEEYLTDMEIDRVMRQDGGLETRHATGHTVTTLTGRGRGQLMHTRYEWPQGGANTAYHDDNDDN